MPQFQFRVRLLALAGATVLLALVLPRAATAAPARAITARQLKPRAHTLRPGTRVRASKLVGVRVFVNASRGFAIVNTNQAQYPAATVDGGRTWRTDGPALHINAADAPESVLDLGAAGRRRVFAYGGGQVVDVTSDGGKHWWQAFLGDDVLSVVAFGNRLIAVAQDAVGSGSRAQTVVYVSRDGGRHWHLNNKLGAP
jgi:photosystem II stability/assembly factor-like uncharacterized protein